MQELNYYKPINLIEALELLDIYGKDIKVLAGGTDLIVALREKLVVCQAIMDIKGIKELQGINYSEEEGLSIGAAVCLNDVIHSDIINSNYSILKEAAKTLANSLLRNRATLVGNICNASPGGDMLSPSIVLEGKVEVVSKHMTKILPLKEFFLGVKRTALNPNEMVTRIIFPNVKGEGKYLRKSRIKGHDLAQVAVAAFLKKDGGLKFSIGAAGPTPIVIEGFEEYKKVNLLNSKDEIIKKVISSIKPISDQRASKEFRIAMVEYLTKNILEELGKEV